MMNFKAVQDSGKETPRISFSKTNERAPKLLKLKLVGKKKSFPQKTDSLNLIHF